MREFVAVGVGDFPLVIFALPFEGERTADDVRRRGVLGFQVQVVAATRGCGVAFDLHLHVGEPHGDNAVIEHSNGELALKVAFFQAVDLEIVGQKGDDSFWTAVTDLGGEAVEGSANLVFIAEGGMRPTPEEEAEDDDNKRDKKAQRFFHSKAEKSKTEART